MKFILLIVLTLVCGVTAQFCNNTAADCNYNGLCTADNSCKCFNNYVTHESLSGCNYSQKKRLTAFLLEFFLGTFGAGWFYLDRIDFAVPVLVLTIVFSCCVSPYYKGLQKNDINEKDLTICCVMSFYYGMIITIASLVLHGMIMTGTGIATDSNGVTVGDW